jgi:anhydro-N-acetylmuramic acid kinase
MSFSKQYKVLGLMSGTSLDGIDLAFITFNYDKVWQYELGVCQTFAYQMKWLKELKELHLKSRDYINKIDIKYAEYLSQTIESFISNNKLDIDLICSHGHTILHEPKKGVTLQIGNGEIINKLLNIPVVSDFRSGDVALGGQGAPLVPIGDDLLFSNYDYCLNLGGFSNFSFKNNGLRQAYDICPVNIVLNEYANKLGKEYDNEGQIGKIGSINNELLNELNGISYYQNLPPKSLGKEWLEKDFLPILKRYNDSVPNIMRTVVEHIAIQIADCIKLGQCLVTGGGALNTFLMQRIAANSQANFILGNKKLIEYKEALIFGLLGVLNREGEINCLASVTGAKRNSIVGKYFT